MAQRSMADLLAIFSGAFVWVAHFSVIYGVTALACAGRLRPEVVPWWVGGATLPAAAALIAILALSQRGARTDRFAAWLTGAVAAFSLLAVLWQALPVLLLPACD